MTSTRSSNGRVASRQSAGKSRESLRLMHNLDDPSQTSFYIPYAPDDEEEKGGTLRDARVAAYKSSWAKCLHRLRAEIDSLYSPTAASIAHGIATACDDVLPGLPYPELPVIAVHHASSLFIDIVLDQLPHAAIVSHLYPSDAPNLPTGMKNLISGFLESDSTLAKRRSPRFAAYDICTLSAWYSSLDSKSQLLVVLHDFEQFDSSVMQDLLYICSTRIPDLPLTFLIFLTSPPTPSYLHAAYPRSTLTCLRVQSFTVQTGRPVLERLLLCAFFNPSFDSDLMLGPAALAAIIDHCTRHDSSVDALFTCIQLVYLKHFLVEPLSVFIQPPSALSTDAEYAPILALLHSRLSSLSPSTPPPQELGSLLNMLAQRHTTFLTHARNLRLGFTLLHTLHAFLAARGYKPLHPRSGGLTSVMLSVLRGQAGRDVKAIGMYVKKLRTEALHDLLDDLDELYSGLPNSVKKAHEAARAKIALFRSAEPDALEAEDVGEWLIAYIQDLIQPLERHPLWDIWYTGASPFPSELLNPSIRASIISGLLRPYDFTLPLPLPLSPQPLQTVEEAPPLSPTVSDLEAQLESTHVSHNDSRELHTLPDTSILFRRYLDSGKLINIYDWYESFKVVLDAQREERIHARAHVSGRKGKEKEKGKGKGKLKSGTGSRTGSPTKRKAKQKQIEVEDVEIGEGEMEEEPDEEAWSREVQARFIRALHELDYLGFVKHTGRRVEHVARVVFDVGDEDDEGDDE